MNYDGEMEDLMTQKQGVSQVVGERDQHSESMLSGPTDMQANRRNAGVNYNVIDVDRYDFNTSSMSNDGRRNQQEYNMELRSGFSQAQLNINRDRQFSVPYNLKGTSADNLIGNTARFDENSISDLTHTHHY